MTHTCHWPGCSASIKSDHWLCFDHFEVMPGALRARVTATYRQAQQAGNLADPNYRSAVAACRAWIAAQGDASGDLFASPEQEAVQMPQGP